MSVKVTKNRMAEVIKAMGDLASKEVLIGIPEDRSGRDDDAPLGNASIGYIQETGSPINNLPARPFLVPGVASVNESTTRQLKKGAAGALSGDAEAAGNAMDAAGLIAQNAVRARINSGIDPPLAESTLASRRARGRTGEVPLIDTAQLRNAVSYVIRKKK
jgi:hypothetical protein